MLLTMLIANALATSAFVLISCWRRRPHPWMDSAASACVRTAVFWTLMIVPGAIWLENQRATTDMGAYWLSCCFLLGLASCVTAFVLGLFSEFLRRPAPSGTELGLSPAEQSE